MAQQNNGQEQDLNQLRKVRREKLAELQQNGKDPFVITKYEQTHHSQEIKDNFDELEGKTVSIAGRMMSKRVMGKASFCNVQDLKGNIQSYVARDSVGEENYKEFKKLDVGDVIGIEGEVFRTKTGEMSIHAAHVTLLSKSLQILPEKFHGLTNTDIRYRQRYVDLIMNPEVKDTFVKRSKILSSIRKYLDGEGFMEVETPMLVANAGGAAARPFETHFNALNEDLKLRISLELYLKRLIVGGLERVYEIGRVFRNEGLDTRHNPEFTLMELYQAYTDYNGMMDLTENLYRHVAQDVLGTTKIVYNGIEMDLGKPFERITMVDAVKKYSGVDWNEVETLEQARELALLSRAVGRQIGLLINRRGRVEMVIVGEPGSLLIPELPRSRVGADRLRGLRLLHTHLTPDLLSQEDLMAYYPEESVLTMARIAAQIEKDVNQKPDSDMNMVSINNEITAQLARSAVRATLNLPVKAIIIDTMSGRTGRYLSAFRGNKPVYAICYKKCVMRQLAISYGIYAMYSEQSETHNSFLLSTLYSLERKRWLFKEDLVVVLGGSFGPEKGASFMEIGNVINFQHKAIKREITCNQE